MISYYSATTQLLLSYYSATTQLLFSYCSATVQLLLSGWVCIVLGDVIVSGVALQPLTLASVVSAHCSASGVSVVLRSVAYKETGAGGRVCACVLYSTLVNTS